MVALNKRIVNRYFGQAGGDELDYLTITKYD